MASKTTDSIWSDSNKVGTSTGAGWLSCPISTLTNALNNTNNIPSNAKITKIIMHVTADFDCGMGLANVYLKYGFGSTNSINEYLLQGSGEGEKFTKTTPLEYPEGGIDITKYLSKDTSPFAITTTHGSYLAFRFYSTNIFSKTYYVNSLTLEITYDEYFTVTVRASPPEGGTVSGAGIYKYGEYATFEAIPNEGYKFVRWLIEAKGGGYSPVGSNPVSFATVMDREAIAEFEKTAINNILADTSQSLGVLLDLSEPSEILADETKVYG